MKKYFLIASMAALFCSCQGQQQQQSRSSSQMMDDQNFQQRRQQMQQQQQTQPQKGGCCGVEKPQEAKQTTSTAEVKTAEVKVEKAQ